jgi:hypothetical protein
MPWRIAYMRSHFVPDGLAYCLTNTLTNARAHSIPLDYTDIVHNGSHICSVKWANIYAIYSIHTLANRGADRSSNKGTFPQPNYDAYGTTDSNSNGYPNCYANRHADDSTNSITTWCHAHAHTPTHPRSHIPADT